LRHMSARSPEAARGMNEVHVTGEVALHHFTLTDDRRRSREDDTNCRWSVAARGSDRTPCSTDCRRST
jgi:dihydroorotase-like cyclic amidohydrolase